MLTHGLTKGFQRILWVKRSGTNKRIQVDLQGMIFMKVKINMELRFNNEIRN